MKLVPVNPFDELHVTFLFELLRLRPPQAAVSHKKMPTLDQHAEFVSAHPYYDWSLIEIGAGQTMFVGSAFLSQPARPSVVGDELHVEVHPFYRGKGYASQALRMMMQRHPRARYVANVGHINYPSMALFQRLGFTLCQHTFELSMVEW